MQTNEFEAELRRRYNILTVVHHAADVTAILAAIIVTGTCLSSLWQVLAVMAVLWVCKVGIYRLARVAVGEILGRLRHVRSGFRLAPPDPYVWPDTLADAALDAFNYLGWIMSTWIALALAYHTMSAVWMAPLYLVVDLAIAHVHIRIYHRACDALDVAYGINDDPDACD